jgi:hypothetical protein
MNENKDRSIIVESNCNGRAAKLLDFFEVRISYLPSCIIIKYENVDQVPAICRLLVSSNIDIIRISVDN